MTKEITKAHIIQEIEDKLNLRELIPERFSFSETVVPTYGIEAHIRDHWLRHTSISITSAAAFLFWTIPRNERWTIRSYNVTFMAAGAYKVAGVYIERIKSVPAGAFVYLDLKKNQTDSYLINLPVPVVCNPGDKIHANIDDYTSTADLRIDMDYTMEIIR